MTELSLEERAAAAAASPRAGRGGRPSDLAVPDVHGEGEAEEEGVDFDAAPAEEEDDQDDDDMDADLEEALADGGDSYDGEDLEEAEVEPQPLPSTRRSAAAAELDGTDGVLAARAAVASPSSPDSAARRRDRPHPQSPYRTTSPRLPLSPHGLAGLSLEDGASAGDAASTPRSPAGGGAAARGRTHYPQRDPLQAQPSPVRCINPASDVNARLDTQVEVRVYPCNNNNQSGKKKYTGFTIKPEGVIIQGSGRNRAAAVDLGAEYAMHIGRKLQRYELSDTRACQLLVTTHGRHFWVVPAPEAFSRHSGTCRLLGDRKHPPAQHVLQVGDFLRVGSVGVVVIETHDGVENRVLSEEKIQKIMKDTTNSNGGFLDLQETDGENSDDSTEGNERQGRKEKSPPTATLHHEGDNPVCYMCFDEEDSEVNPMITPCKCSGDTKYVHVDCLRKWHTAEADNQICFLSSVDATCSVCKSTFKSDFKLSDGRQVKLFKSSLEPPYVSLLVATKHEMAQRLFNTRFQLSFSTLLKPDGRNSTRPLLLGRSSGSDMVLDYRTVSGRHASIKFKNGEFVFTDAGSSNGSYLYLRRPLMLTASQPVQFRLGRSMISMKVVNKWNRRLLRAVRRSTLSGGQQDEEEEADDRSIGSTEGDVRVTDGATGMVTRTVTRRTRDDVMRSLPTPGQLSQQSSKHLDLLYALAYPKRDKDASLSRSAHSRAAAKIVDNIVQEVEMKEEESETSAPVDPSPTSTTVLDS